MSDVAWTGIYILGQPTEPDLLRPNIDNFPGAIHGWAGSTVDHLKQCLEPVRLGIHICFSTLNPSSCGTRVPCMAVAIIARELSIELILLIAITYSIGRLFKNIKK